MESKIVFLILIFYQIYRSLCFEIFLMNKIIIQICENNNDIYLTPQCVKYLNNSLNKFIEFCKEKDNKLEDIFDEKNLFNVSKIGLNYEIYSHIYSSSSFTKNKFYSLYSCKNENHSHYLYFMVEIETNIEAEENKDIYIGKEYLNFEDSYILYGFCLPFNESFQTCDNNDVKEIIHFTNDIMDNYLFPSNSTILISIIDHNCPYKVLGYIIIGIILFQIALITFTYPLYRLFGKIFKKKKKIEEDENNNDKHNDKYLIPKWLTNFKSFSLSNNIHELFNVKSNSTEMNNYSGLYAIRGLNAISMFFTVLGLTFIGIYNSPLKITGISQMRKLLFHTLYFLVFIGLRYSPRIIFSCSGYTLSYKYLSFMDKYSIDFSFMKFAFYQFYKYFILIFYNLFFRYSLNLLIRKFFPYWFFLQKKIVNNYKKNFPIFMSFLGVDLFLENKTKKSDQNLNDYFWIPYNEVFFFIFGIILMTIGYKYKLKIDIFILVLIFLSFVGKITFSYLYSKSYSTLYYYLFDYGKFMLNPLFNITYFLIGIYFGLINYALQKGATNKFDNSIFNKIKKFSFEKKEENKANFDKDNINNDEITSENNFVNITKNKDDNNINIFNRVSEYSSFSESTTSYNIDNTSLDNEEVEEDNDPLEYNYSSNEIMIEIPFLYTIVKYINNRRKFRHYKTFYFLFFLLISLPVGLHYLILYLYNGKGKLNELREQKNIKEFYETLNLYDYITNFALNLIFRIDIDIFILLVHWFFIDLHIMGKYNILTFFTNISWGIFDKSCFSFEIISNMIILFVIYSSDTFISVNIYTIFLYFIFILVLILLFTFLNYIYLELPLKKITKLILKKDDNFNNYEEDTFIKEEENEEKNKAKKEN